MSLNIQTCKLHDYVGTGPCGLCVASVSDNYCERCQKVSAEGVNDDLICPSCAESDAEAAYDRYMERMASGDCGPLPLEEQQRQAWRLK